MSCSISTLFVNQTKFASILLLTSLLLVTICEWFKIVSLHFSQLVNSLVVS